MVVYCDAHNKPLRLAGTLFDISEQKQIEAEKEALQHQLQHSQKLHSIGQLAGGIAHDFNNILSSIVGYNALATEECPVNDPEYLGYLEQVGKAGARAQKLISQLMTFSRRDIKEMEQVSPAELVGDALKMLKTVLPKAIELSVDSEQGLPDIKVNQVQMHQIITNLIINARDAIWDVGKIRVEVRRRSLNHDLCTSCQQYFSGDFIEISITDTGQGIAQENLVPMFEPFFTTKEIGKGTGMGLSMVHGLVHSHEGHIEVESKQGEGTRFSIFVPVYNGTTEAALSGAEKVVSEDHHAPLVASGCNVLVVDDEKAITSMICDLLNRHGYHCSEANNPADALAEFSKNPAGFDLVITDQMMPQMEGFEMARIMLSVRPDLSIIMCTGYSGSVTQQDVEQAGLKGIIDKPIDFNRLFQMIDGVVIQRQV